MRYILLLLTVLLVSCGTAVPTIKPYKLDIQQGNVVTSKMLLQLRPGMTKSQVRYIMGTPLIQDSFHGNRWDYFYQMREAGKVIEQRRVILDFENELLKTVRGDVVPSESDANAKTDKPIGTRVVEPEAKPEPKGFFDKLKFWKKDEAELAKEAEQAKIDADKKSAQDAQKPIEITPAATEISGQKTSPVEEVKVLPESAIKLESSESMMPQPVLPVEPEVKPDAEKKGFFERLKFWKGDDDNASSTEEVKSLSGVPIVEIPDTASKDKK